MPPTAEPTHGRPRAIASTIARGRPSVRDGSTKRFASSSTRRTGSPAGSAPANVICSLTRCAAARLELGAMAAVADEHRAQVEPGPAAGGEGVDQDVLRLVGLRHRPDGDDRPRRATLRRGPRVVREGERRQLHIGDADRVRRTGIASAAGSRA